MDYIDILYIQKSRPNNENI